MKEKKFAKKLIAVMTVLFLAATAFGCAEKEQADQESDVSVSKGNKTIVIYFSWSGHLRQMSQWVADEAKADVVRILAKEDYPEDYDETTDRAKKELDEGIRPEIKENISDKDLKQYDTVVFGYPVWWYDLPMPMWTFLESHDLSGKTVVPMFSHEGSSDGADSLDTLKKLAKGADVKTDVALSVRGTEVKDSEDEVRKWAKENVVK